MLVLKRDRLRNDRMLHHVVRKRNAYGIEAACLDHVHDGAVILHRKSTGNLAHSLKAVPINSLDSDGVAVLIDNARTCCMPIAGIDSAGRSINKFFLGCAVLAVLYANFSRDLTEGCLSVVRINVGVNRSPYQSKKMKSSQEKRGNKAHQ